MAAVPTRPGRSRAGELAEPAAPVRLAPAGPAQPQRGIRFPQLLLSLLVVGVFGLLGLWWAASSAARIPVVGLATAVTQGQALEPGDLTTIHVSSEGELLATTPAQFLDLFVGKVAKTDFEAGTLVTASMFQTAEPLAAGEAFVGLELPNNHFPASLAVGDIVDVLILNGRADDAARSFDNTASVESVDTDRQGRTRIRLRMDASDAVSVQRAAATDDVALIEVFGGAPG